MVIVMKKMIILVCFLLLLVGCGEKEMKENNKSIKEDKVSINKITCDKMKELMNDGAILIDVREKDEYDERHLDKAINISYTVISQEISNYVPNKDNKIIVYCKSGARSNKAANYLLEAGYTNIYDLGSINNCDTN